MQCGLLGHHATIIQTLPVAIGLDNERMIVLDKMRRSRIG
jgi:hypothetical protein